MRRRNFLKAMLVSPLLGLAKGEKGLSEDEVLVLEPDITYYKYIPDGNPFLGELNREHLLDPMPYWVKKCAKEYRAGIDDVIIKAMRGQ